MPIANAMLMCLLVAVLALNGCSSGQTDRPQQSNRLGALAVFYGRYVGTHGGRAPANQGELASFIKKSGEPTLKQFGITRVEELFEPADDGQSIVVSYGRINMTDPNPIIAYESQTIGDKRRVLRSTGAVDEVAESDFQKYRPMASTK